MLNSPILCPRLRGSYISSVLPMVFQLVLYGEWHIGLGRQDPCSSDNAPPERLIRNCAYIGLSLGVDTAIEPYKTSLKSHLYAPKR